MTLVSIATVVEWLIGAWLALIFLIVFIKMASGTIILGGLLRLERTAPFGFDRIQLLFVTLLFAAGYTINGLAQGPGEGLPDIKDPLLLVLIGSNATYLAVRFAVRGGAGRGK